MHGSPKFTMRFRFRRKPKKRQAVEKGPEVVVDIKDECREEEPELQADGNNEAQEPEYQLPSKQDRALMLRAIMVAADDMEAERTTTNKNNVYADTSRAAAAADETTATASQVLSPKKQRNQCRFEKYKHRLTRVLQDELVPAAATSLLLVPKQDSTNYTDEEYNSLMCCALANAAILAPILPLENAFGCIVLLLSNIVLLYGEKYGGYDARVRHVLRAACVNILCREQGSMKQDDEALIDTIMKRNSNNRAPGGVVVRANKPQTQQQPPTPLVMKEEKTEQTAGTTDEKGDTDMADYLDENSSTGMESEKSQSPTVEQQGADDFAAPAESTTDSSSSSINNGNNFSLVEVDEALIKRQNHRRFLATRKFQAIETEIAAKIFKTMALIEIERQKQDGKIKKDKKTDADDEQASHGQPHQILTRRRIVRGLQIGSVGVVAGTLFAVTGGLAAPAIAAGIAGLGIASGSATATAAIAILTTVKAVTAVFGVGGGGLAAYKMKKRTDGLSEFQIRREGIEQNIYLTASDESIRRGIAASLPQLHTTICISGWLQDKSDFQRPWGIQPTDPPIEDKVELLKRFYTVHAPEKVATCEEYLKQRKKKEKKNFDWELLCRELEAQYGRNPEHLLPLDSAETKEISSLSKDEEAVVNDMLEKVVFSNHYKKSSKKVQEGNMASVMEIEGTPDALRLDGTEDSTTYDSSLTQDCGEPEAQVSKHPQGNSSELDETMTACDSAESSDADDEPENSQQLSTEVKDEDNVPVVWDWHALLGGDLHTVTWESKVLLGLSHIVGSMAQEVTTQATKQALTYAAFVGALVAAVAVPSALMTVSQLIDDPYQIVILRADEAGKELAKCLLQSDERRPVTLVGYSFGARVLYSCLMELSRHQDLWEEQQEQSQEEDVTKPSPGNQIDGVPFEYTREPASIVEDVIFMGLPRLIDYQAMSVCRQIVGGRLVNCYSRNDWLLSLMFLCRAGTQTCGTYPVEGVPGIENYNVTDLVEAHSKYGDAVPKILELVSSLC